MDEESFIDCRCPHCGIELSYPADSVGLTQECPGCMQTVIVPKSSGAQAHQLPVPVTTARLTLRRLESGDWKDVLAFMSDDEVLRYINWWPVDENTAIEWVEKHCASRFTDPGGTLVLALELRESRRVIGCVSIRFLDGYRTQAEFTLLVNRSHQGQGYGTEATIGALDLCFRGLNLHRVALHADVRNLAGCRMLEKAGLRREGDFLEDQWINGEWVSTAYFAMLTREFAARHR